MEPPSVNEISTRLFGAANLRMTEMRFDPMLALKLDVTVRLSDDDTTSTLRCFVPDATLAQLQNVN